jgi:hypothetical protein
LEDEDEVEDEDKDLVGMQPNLWNRAQYVLEIYSKVSAAKISRHPAGAPGTIIEIR